VNSKTNDIKLLLFDLDGTLLDSRAFLVSESFLILEKYYPGHYTEEQIQADFGSGFKKLLPNIEDERHELSLKEFHKVKEEKYHLLKYFPGVIDGLHKLREMGYRLGVVTNQNKQLAMKSIHENNLLDLFDVIIGDSDVEVIKPSPEGVFQAIDKLNVNKENTVMVGDSSADILAGTQAGVKTVFLKWYEDTHIPQHPNPDYIYENFDEFIKEI